MIAAPEIAAIRSIAANLRLPIEQESTHAIHVRVGRDVILSAVQYGSDSRETPDPGASWLVTIDLEFRAGKMPRSPIDLAKKLSRALTAIAGVIGKAGTAEG